MNREGHEKNNSRSIQTQRPWLSRSWWRAFATGYRSIILFRKGELAFFVYGFSKSELGNIRADEEAQFKKMAKHALSLTDEQLSKLVANGQF